MATAAIVHFDYAMLVVPFKDPSVPINPTTALVLRFNAPSIGKARKFFRGRNIGHESVIFPKRMRSPYACSALMLASHLRGELLFLGSLARFPPRSGLPKLSFARTSEKRDDRGGVSEDRKTFTPRLFLPFGNQLRHEIVFGTRRRSAPL